MTAADNQSTVTAMDSVVRGFIVGMSRSGTRWLAECLNTHPETAAIGETAFWGRKYVAPSRNGVYSRSDLEKVRRRYRSGCTSTEASQRLVGKNGVVSDLIDKILEEDRRVSPKEFFDTMCAEVARLEGKTHIVEKTPHHINWVSRIAPVFTGAKFIVMVRDPYDFMLSYKHQGDRKVPEVRSNYYKVYHPVGCSIVYKRYAASIRAALDNFGDRCHVIQYGDLKTDPSRELFKVQEYLGLEVHDISLPRVNSSFPGGSRPELMPDDILWMNMIAGKEIRRAGRPIRSVEKDTIGQLTSLLRIPIWAYHSAAHLSQRTGDRFIPYLRKWLFG